MAADDSKNRGLTIEQLKSFKNYENITDEQAQETIFAIKTLASLFYEHIKRKKGAGSSNNNETDSTTNNK